MTEGTKAPPKTKPAWPRFLMRLIEALNDVVEPALLRVSPGRRLVVVEADGDDFAFHRVSGRTATFIGNGGSLGERERRVILSNLNRDVELRLAPERVILATLKIPADGLGYTGQIVESRLDRLTPWKPEKLLFGFATAAEADGDGQFRVDFAATSREIAGAAITRLGVFGLTPSRMGCAMQPVAERLRIDLLRGENDAVRTRRRRHIATVAIALPVVCLTLYISSLFMAFQSAARIKELDDSLTTARRLLVGGADGTGERQRDAALIAGKTPESARFILIDRLATILPETTVISELDIQNEGLRMAGTSTEASGLIRILESEPFFSDARFAAPVTRQDDGRDRFDITVRRAALPTETAP